MCQAHAMWQAAICNPKDCGSIPTILNGVYTLLYTKQTTYGSTANVTCDAGYKSNVSQIMCQANAMWQAAICNPKDCGSIPTILNGVYTLLYIKQTTYGSTANVTCDAGYESNIRIMTPNVTSSEVLGVLSGVANVTEFENNHNSSELLTNADLALLTNALDHIANLVFDNTRLATNDVAETFLQSASNIIGVFIEKENKGTLLSLKQA
ncbi:hypothetical protein DPMN_055476, partial [Dreissena polymorpha]